MDARTNLFVPGDRPERFGKALASGADAIVLDLEDAVAPAAKSHARDAIAQWSLQAAETEIARIVVRINDAASDAFSDDLRLLRAARIATVMLPKAESVAQAKLCIHPRQVAPIHIALAPTHQAIDWARRVLAAEAASPGAAQLEGRMIDRPVMLQALHRSGASHHTTP